MFMPYKVSFKDSKQFFVKRGDREVSTSNVVKVELGSKVNKPPQRKRHLSMKRLRSEEKVINLTGEHFPFTVVAEEHFQSQVDCKILENAGKIATARYMQVQAAWFMSMEIETMEEEKAQQSKKVESLQKSMERAKKLQLALEQVALEEKETGLLKEENEELRN
ncbi:hypothetical protein PIB30_060086 [Stylosanthes scabra]|uniref:Uncharacterized protein n=1 Tax=Stylosanthes scabra TaxID=79078 RepID=A0ABU6WIW9_9FABA|nr:hypothetical protein [Stylosanthes scabra]